MSSLSGRGGKLKARRSENVGENCGCSRTQTHTNTAGALGLKTTSSGGTGEQASRKSREGKEGNVYALSVKL